MKHDKDSVLLTRDHLRTFVDVLTMDKNIADTKLPCYLGTPERDRLIEQFLKKVRKL